MLFRSPSPKMPSAYRANDSRLPLRPSTRPIRSKYPDIRRSAAAFMRFAMDPFDHGEATSAIPYRNYFTIDRNLSGFADRKDDAVWLIWAANARRKSSVVDPRRGPPWPILRHSPRDPVGHNGLRWDPVRLQVPERVAERCRQTVLSRAAVG